MPRRASKSTQAVLAHGEYEAVQGYSISNFERFEAIVGRQLPVEERRSLTAAAKDYLLARAIEINSPKTVAIKKRIATVKQSAGALRTTLSDAGDGGIGFLAGKAISEHLADRPFSRRITGQVNSSAVALLMRDIERACDAAIRLSVYGEQRSPAWVRLVRKLQTWAKDAGISTAVSKRLQGKGGALQLSPFAGLVKALQDQFPAQYRQHTQSDDALAWATSKALRELMGQKR